MDIVQFQSLLNALRNPNNEERASAEGAFFGLVGSNAMMVIEYLIKISQANQTDQYLFLHCLILLKIVFNRSSGAILSDRTNDQNIHLFLLSLIDNPSSFQPIQLNSATLIFTIAKLYIPNQRWPSFETDLIQRIQSQNVVSVSISLDCLVLSSRTNLINLAQISSLMDGWYQMIWPTEPSYLHILIIRLIFILAKKGFHCQCFSDFANNFPSYLCSLPFSFANMALAELTSYTDIFMNFFWDSFNTLFECLMTIYTNNQAHKGEREQILELIIELIENNPNQMYQYAQPLFSGIMSVICEISGPDFMNEFYEDPTPRTSSEKSIHRIAYEFSQIESHDKEFSILLFTIFNNFNEMSDSPEKVRASFVLLRKTMKYLTSFFDNSDASEPLVRKIMEGLHYQVPFCQISSLQLLTKAAKYLSESGFEHNYNSVLIHPLLMYIDANPEISEFALESLSTLISYSSDDDICSNLPELYQAVISMFGRIPVQAQVFALNCISSLIEKTSSEQMSFYYQTIVPMLVSVIQSNNMTLILPAIKAFSNIGVVYISEQYVSDSKTFIDFILTINRDGFTDDQNDTLNSAITAFVWALCDQYPEDFAQLMASIINIIDQPVVPKEVPMAIDRSDFLQEIIVPNENENTLCIYSRKVLNDIHKSLCTLHSFFSKVTQASVPYYQKLIEVLMKTVTYYFCDDIQSESIDCLYELVASLYENGVTDFNPFVLILENFNNVIMNNFQKFDITLEFLNFAVFLSECIPNPESVAPRFLFAFLALAERSIQKYKTESDFGPLDVYIRASKILKFVMKCPQTNQDISSKLQWFSQSEFPLNIEVPPFLVPGVSVFWSSLVVNILHDAAMFSNVLQFICTEINNPEVDGKYTIIMSLDTLIQSDLFTANHSQPILASLSEFISLVDETEGELKNLIDAAIYIISALILKFPDLASNEGIMNTWFNALPLKKKNNSPCFRKVYDLLLILISQSNPIITHNLSHLLKVISKVVRNEYLSDEIKMNFKGFVRSLVANPQSKPSFDEALACLNKKDQSYIFLLLSDNEEE